ncbi:MAG: acyl-CoA/acyl-ACP dehydrogenase [Thaumarchaeota archaeon]|nr:acyl-CoA/acyl-ACP dehydrogenase [Nitrososphaerota archaeon]
MESTLHQGREEIRQGIKDLCSKFPETYWRKKDADQEYPEEFVKALTEGGWLSMLIPEQYGGLGMGMSHASIVLEEINRSGGLAAPAHAQMYIMGAILRHGSPEQKENWLPPIAKGKVRLQAFGVTEPAAGSDTSSITTFAKRDGDLYRIHGQKIFTSRVQHSDLMLVLVRTTPREKVQKKTDGMTLLLLDLNGQKTHIRVKPIRTMINHETNEVFFDGAEAPVNNRIGEEGQGFRYILSGLNAERILVASESVGDGRYFVDKAVAHSSSRIVFGRPIGQNQGVQYPIAKAHISLEAASLVRDHAAMLFDRGERDGVYANMAKYLASNAAWEAANTAMDAFGGYGYAVEYNIERKFREARLPLVAPVPNNLILSHIAEHVLGLPRSY